MISVVSDVHIKKKGDRPYRLFLDFLNHEKTSESEHVFLLGDIFDLLVGGNRSFYEEFEEVFQKLEDLMNHGKTVYYIDGNHDFHLEKFFSKNVKHRNFIYSKKAIHLEIEERKYYFCHGDDIEIENLSYKIYYSVIRSPLIKFLAEDIVPFSFTKSIGDWASSRSRKKNIKKYEERVDIIKDKFRRSAENLFKNNRGFEVLVSGHSHVKDSYKSELGFKYINNGFFPKEQTFLFIKDGSDSFISLTETSL